MRSSVERWYLRISRNATVPGLGVLVAVISYEERGEEKNRARLVGHGGGGGGRQWWWAVVVVGGEMGWVVWAGRVIAPVRQARALQGGRKEVVRWRAVACAGEQGTPEAVRFSWRCARCARVVAADRSCGCEACTHV